MRIGILALLIFPGCCLMAKRECFPPCPSIKSTTIAVETGCKLPPQLTLEPFRTTRQACPGHLICLDRQNAARLARRIVDQRDWIAEAHARCGPQPPASQPAGPLTAPPTP